MTTSAIACIAFFLVTLQEWVSGECSTEEMIQYSSSVIDIPVLALNDCESILYETISRECCEAVARVMDHECAIAGQEFFLSQGISNSPHYDVLLSVSARCNLGFGVGHLNTTDCGNGVVEDWEKCDDGNTVDGDGCGGCFIESPYTCTQYSSHIVSPAPDLSTPDHLSTSDPSTTTQEGSLSPYSLSFVENTLQIGENGTSFCRLCAQDCGRVHREICHSPHAACGDCLEGYTQNEEGYCARIKFVHYASVNIFSPTATSHCVFHAVGDVLEPTPYRTAVTYLDLVRQWSEDRTALWGRGSCDVATAVETAPSDDDVVLVLEVVIPVAEASWVKLLSGNSVVIFSESQPFAKLVSNIMLFDIYIGTTLYLYNVVLSDARGYEGVIRNFGNSVLEGVTIEHCSENDLIGSGDLNYMCSGLLINSAGDLTLRGVVFRNNTVSNVANEEACLILGNTMIYAMGRVFLSDVSFLDNYSESTMLNLKFAMQDSIVEKLTFRRNFSYGSLVFVDMDIDLRDLVFEENTGGVGGLLYLSGETSVQNFEMRRNIVIGDGGLLRNIGTTRISHGLVEGSQPPGWGGAIVNRGLMNLAFVTFDSNQMGAVSGLSGSIEMYSCKFFLNTALAYFSAIYNTAYLEINDSEFVVGENTKGLTIWSDDPFFLRSSSLPAAETMKVASCSTRVFKGGGKPKTVCGVQAQCEILDDSGALCQCPRGYIGSPLQLCAPPADLHVLPDTTITRFVTKDGHIPAAVEVLGLITDGLGDVTWRINNDTVPDWLVFRRLSGRFASQERVCLAEMVPIEIEFLTAGVNANNTERSAEVLVETMSSYQDFRMMQNVTLNIQMSVRVLAHAEECRVYPATPCADDGWCNAEAGSRVRVVIEFFDYEGLAVAANDSPHAVRVLEADVFYGGATSTFSSSSLALISVSELSYGRIQIHFDAPPTHFVVVVDIAGRMVVGSPIPYRIRCSSGTEWSDADSECKDYQSRMPVRLMVLTCLILLVVTTFIFVNLWRTRYTFRIVFRLVMGEVMRVCLRGAGELLDVLSDVGAFVSVLLSDDLQSYLAGYTIVISFTLITSAYYFCICVSDLRRALRRQRSGDSARAVSTACGTSMCRPVVVLGVGTLRTLEEVDEVLDQMHRVQRRMLIELVLLVIEDLPMLSLGTDVLINERGRASIFLLVSLQVSCVIMGLTLTNVRAIKDTRAQIARLTARRALATEELANEAKMLSEASCGKGGRGDYETPFEGGLNADGLSGKLVSPFCGGGGVSMFSADQTPRGTAVSVRAAESVPGNPSLGFAK
eukprot:Rmarinus@m.1959